MHTINVSKNGPITTLAKAKSEIIKLQKSTPTENFEINLSEGIWDEGVTLPTNTSVKGIGPKTIIKPPLGITALGWQSSNAGDIEVSNLDIEMPKVTNGMGIKYLSDNAGSIKINNLRIKSGYKNITIQSKNKGISLVAIADCVLLDSDGANTAAIYLDGVLNYIIADNVIDKAGHLRKDSHCHGIYIQKTCGQGNILDNFISRSAAHGIQQRGGGLLGCNFLYSNPCGLYSSNVNGLNKIIENIVIESPDIGPNDARGWGLEIFPGNSVVQDNIMGNMKGRNNKSIFGKIQKPDFPFIDGFSDVSNNMTDIVIDTRAYSGMVITKTDNIENAKIPSMEKFTSILLNASDTLTPIEDFINCLRNRHLRWNNEYIVVFKDLMYEQNNITA